MADWTQLDDLVQVSYSVTEAVIVYSRYTDQAWWLHVFRESEAYAVVFEGTAGMETIMVRLEVRFHSDVCNWRSNSKDANL